jgi:hypothetical protein
VAIGGPLIPHSLDHPCSFNDVFLYSNKMMPYKGILQRDEKISFSENSLSLLTEEIVKENQANTRLKDA